MKTPSFIRSLNPTEKLIYSWIDKKEIDLKEILRLVMGSVKDPQVRRASGLLGLDHPHRVRAGGGRAPDHQHAIKKNNKLKRSVVVEYGRGVGRVRQKTVQHLNSPHDTKKGDQIREGSTGRGEPPACWDSAAPAASARGAVGSQITNTL